MSEGGPSWTAVPWVLRALPAEMPGLLADYAPDRVTAILAAVKLAEAPKALTSELA